MSLPTPYYERGPVKLYHGDCLELLPHLSGIDVVLTDPPYGEKDTHKSHLSSVVLRSGKAAGNALGFDGISEEQMIEIARSLVNLASRWVVFTCEWKFCRPLADAGLLVRHGIWRKPDGAPQFTGDRPGTGWEAVAVCHRPGKKRWNGGGRHGFWTFPKGTNRSGHPTGKPAELFEAFCRDFSDEGSTVLDPFFGRGTTAIACIRTGRRCVGIEKSEEHCEKSAERIDKELDQKRIDYAPAAKPETQRELFAEAATCR